MPKIKKSILGKYKPVLPGVLAITNGEDLFGEKYKQSLEGDCVPSSALCFLCKTSSEQNIDCFYCEFKYGYCREHKDAISIVIMNGKCIFCLRYLERPKLLPLPTKKIDEQQEMSDFTR